MIIPSFSISKIPVFGKVLLAPMDGYTDLPFRLLCRQQGSSLSFSEFINGIDVKNGHPHLRTKLLFSENERPFAYQIFDDDPERLVYAALELQKMGPDFIDVNMGCSARNVSNRGAGAGLLKEPKKIAYIIDRLVQTLDIPITAKIRLGWDDNSRNYPDIARIIEENGASAISIHARTRKQEYSGLADWNAIGEVKQIVHIPVIGNGDITSYAEALSRLTTYGVDAVMIGRAAIGNPWIFNPLMNYPSDNDKYSLIKSHIRLMVEHYGEVIGIRIFRKHLTRYLSQFLVTSEIRKQIFSITQENELLLKIAQLMRLE